LISKKIRATKIDDVIADIPGELSNTFHKMNREADNHLWQKNKMEINYNRKNNTDMSKNQNLKHKDQKKRKLSDEEEIILLDIKED